MEPIIKWLSVNYVELLGAVLGFAYIFYSIRQSILICWVFLTSKLYADMGLQLYYVVVSIYGWYEWVSGRQGDNNEGLKVSRINIRLIIYLTIVSVLIFLLIWYVLSNFTDSPVPMADALATGLSIVATWMLARKILEHWLVWIFVDAFSVGLFLYKNLMPTVILFVVYTIMAVVGYIEWKRDFKREQILHPLNSLEK